MVRERVAVMDRRTPRDVGRTAEIGALVPTSGLVEAVIILVLFATALATPAHDRVLSTRLGIHPTLADNNSIGYL